MPIADALSLSMRNGSSYSYSKRLSPKYNHYSDESLVSVAERIKAEKNSLIMKIKELQADYKESYDKNTKWMLLTSFTVVVPLLYYGIKAGVVEGLPYNRAEQCSMLINIIDTIGTSEPLGKNFIRKELQALFNILNRSCSQTLMSFLITAYELSKGVHPDILLKELDAYAKTQRVEKISFFFPTPIAKLISEYCEVITDGSVEKIF